MRSELAWTYLRHLRQILPPSLPPLAVFRLPAKEKKKEREYIEGKSCNAFQLRTTGKVILEVVQGERERERMKEASTKLEGVEANTKREISFLIHRLPFIQPW